MGGTRIDSFSPGSKKVHIDIDASSVNKVIQVEMPILGDVAHVLEDVLKIWKARGRKVNRDGLEAEIEIMGQRRRAIRVTTPLFDPDGAVMRG